MSFNVSQRARGTVITFKSTILLVRMYILDDYKLRQIVHRYYVYLQVNG